MQNWFKKIHNPLSHKQNLSIVYLLLFSIAISVVINLSLQGIPSSVEEGEIATHDIRADDDYEIVDEEATAKTREEVLKGTLPVYDWDGEHAGGLKIIQDKTPLAHWTEQGILLKVSLEKEPIHFRDLRQVITLDEAQQRFKKKSQLEHLRVNFFFNEEETNRRRQQALEELQDTVIKIQRGQSIIRTGDRFGIWHTKVVNGIRQTKTKRHIWEKGTGTLLFTFIFLTLFFFTGQKVLKGYRIVPRDLFFQGLLLIGMLLIERLFIFFSVAFRDLLPFSVPQEVFYAMIPIAAGAMMVRMVLSLPAALFFALVNSIFAGLILEQSLLYSLYYITASVFGTYLVAHARSRVTLWRAGLGVGILNMAMMLAFDLMNVNSIVGLFQYDELGSHLMGAFLGGLATAVVVLIFTPIIEFAFNYVTEMQLLELGSLNHPILREMITRAPGTYHHSHMVGTLAEAACEGIGADSLFARVACYFHDIGKMKKSSYFIENMVSGEDRHGQLSPSMSALIIASHVKDGVDLARQFKLPERIIDIIPQHQGTKLISYFYSKAKEQEDPDVHVVKENEYRYPGPKPQTPEAGVILLADTVEAATRALKDRSPARLEEVVRNMINKNFIDGQLDECELTLQDLHTIAHAFVRILIGVYHHRIEYPDIPGKGVGVSTGLMDTDGNGEDKYTQSQPLSEDSLRETKKDPGANIHRLGDSRRS